MTELTKRELDRYSRQIVLPKIGLGGQRKLKNSSVAIIGLGGLGSAAALYLTCAGIGHIRLVDRDVVETNNLQRQVLYNENDAKDARPKADAAKERLTGINSIIDLEAASEEFNGKTGARLVKDMDVVLDCTDNIETRYLINETCVKQNKPLVHGAALGDFGMVTTIYPGKTPCYECIFPKISSNELFPTCEGAGVLGQIAGMIGLVQATEVVKIITGFDKPLNSKLMYIYASPMRMTTVEIERNPYCRVCSKKA